MQIKVLNVDAQVAFKILIILHQFSHKVNPMNCHWLYVNLLLKLFGQEMKFSEKSLQRKLFLHCIQLTSRDQGSL